MHGTAQKSHLDRTGAPKGQRSLFEDASVRILDREDRSHNGFTWSLWWWWPIPFSHLGSCDQADDQQWVDNPRWGTLPLGFKYLRLSSIWSSPVSFCPTSLDYYDLDDREPAQTAGGGFGWEPEDTSGSKANHMSIISHEWMMILLS